MQNFTETYNKFEVAADNCWKNMVQTTKNDMETLQMMKTNIENRLNEFKENDKQCKAIDDASEISYCATEVGFNFKCKIVFDFSKKIWFLITFAESNSLISHFTLNYFLQC